MKANAAKVCIIYIGLSDFAMALRCFGLRVDGCKGEYRLEISHLSLEEPVFGKGTSLE